MPNRHPGWLEDLVDWHIASPSFQSLRSCPVFSNMRRVVRFC